MLSRILAGAEKRSAPGSVYGAATGYPGGWSSIPFFGGRTDSGRIVNPDTALEAVTVYGAISLISSAIGSLPLKVYKDADERLTADTSRQWRMLHDAPNDEMAADEFWELVTANLLGWGNAFILKERDRNGVVQNLWPIRSSRVQVGRTTIGGRSVRYFTVTGVDGPVYETDILHIRGLSYDGQVGFSPIQVARQDIANMLEQNTFRGSFWRNGMFAGGTLTHPNRLSKDAQDRLASQIAEKTGSSRAGELLVLEEAMTLQNLTMPLQDAQFVEQVKLADLKVAQLFGLVPPHMWGQGENSRSMTYQNSEFGGQEFVKWSARKWLVRIEKAVGRDPGIFPAPGPTLYPEFDVSELLRSDMKTRWDTYALGFGKWIDQEWVNEQEHINLDGREIAPPVAPTDNTPVDTPPPDPEPAREQRSAPQVIYIAAPDKTSQPQQLTLTLDERAATAIDTITRALSEAPPMQITLPEQPAPVIENHVHVPEQREQPTPLVENHVHLPATRSAKARREEDGSLTVTYENEEQSDG